MQRGSKTAHAGSLGDLHKKVKPMNTINENDGNLFEDRTNVGQSRMSGQDEGMRNSQWDESVVSRGANAKEQYIQGLTDFLTDEYYKRYGIYTSEEDKLGQFWKDHVSADYKKKREEQAMKRKT